MRITLVNKYFPPFNASTSHLLWDLAKHLGQQHEVQVITGSTAYVADDARFRPPAREVVSNIHVRRIWCLGSNRRSTLSRFADYLSFYIGCFFQLLIGRRSDVVVVMTTPPLLTLPASIVARLRSERLVLWNMDTYPDALIAQGMLSANNPLFRFFSLMAKEGNARCDQVVALDNYMARMLMGHGVAKEKIGVCSNWDRELSGAAQRPERPGASQEFRNSIGVTDNQVVFMYFGNMGLAQESITLYEGMKRLVLQHENAVFFFVGGGPKFAELQRAVSAERLPRIHFRGYVPKDEIAVPLLAADVGLFTLKASYNGVGTPSKMYSLLAAGLPLLYIGAEKCEAADVIRHFKCGIALEEHDVTGFVDGCESYLREPELRAQHGRAGLSAFKERFEMSQVLPQLAELLTTEVRSANG